MNNAMPTFAIYLHRSFMGTVSAVTHKQAVTRARRLHGRRVEVELCGNVAPLARDRVNANVAYQGKRKPALVGDFEARRAAAIAEWQAAQ